MITMSIDNASVQSIVNDIKRLEVAGKKSAREATEWAGVTILRSLGAQTKVSPKKRKIVTQVTDVGGGINAKGRKVRGKKIRTKGVMIWRVLNGKAKEVFFPIDFDKDVPVVHFIGRNNNALVRFISTGNVVSERAYSAMTKYQIAKNSYLAFIRMAGLAKKSWNWMKKRSKRGGGVSERFGGRVVNVGSISWMGDNLTIHNRLGYITDALKGGTSSIDQAIRDGAESFKWKVDELLGLHEIKTQ
jgi:hypothetical protein